MGERDAPLDWKDIRNSAARFILRFKDAKKEESYKQLFWSDFLGMFGVDSIQVGMFEYYVKKLGTKSGEIDYFWPGKVLIEHKSSGKDLDDAMDQAMDYLMGIEKKEELPRYIIVSDFKRIRLMDLVEHKDETIKLQELPDNIEMFGFLAGYSDKRIEGQHPVNIKAAEVMGELYDLLKASGYPAEDLDTLLIRLVFCLFAEDADIFEKNVFTSYLSFHSNEDGSGMSGCLSDIFSVLNTPFESRQKTLSSALLEFPYVNGGLFSKTIASPQFDREMRGCLIGAAKLDWKFISPAIFGSLFQSIMDPKMRRELGAHYTSEENILKLINALFMDDLRKEFETIKGNKKKLREFWDKISAIRVMDPACGCGNFLIISYREMRKLEMDLLDSLYNGQMILDESHLYIDHFYGIEIGEFASMVANMSIILMDHLMNLEMRKRFGQCRNIIPLKEKANIVCANSLRIDWKSLVSPTDLTYIVGNPPFVGTAYQNKEQKEEMGLVFPDNPHVGSIDYVSCWYKKSLDYIQGTGIQCGLVSTNSITQGQQVEALWGYLFDKYDFKINFAFRTFKWNNEAKANAGVHVVIIGFTSIHEGKSKLYMENGSVLYVENITPYLTPGVTTIIHPRSVPMCEVPRMMRGSQPTDGGNLILEYNEKEELERREPKVSPYIRQYMMGDELISGKPRYCLWLLDCPSEELKEMKLVCERIAEVRAFRLSSKKEATRKKASRPHLFDEIKQPCEDFIALPKVSSENRQYVPMAYLSSDVIVGDKIYLVPGGTLYHFGVMISGMHMAWMRAVCGRLESRYSYSNKIVYNTFVWPECDLDTKHKIENAAQAVLDARSKHPTMSLGSMYDFPMPDDLLDAHLKLDQTVDVAYCGHKLAGDSERLEILFDLYARRIND